MTIKLKILSKNYPPQKTQASHFYVWVPINFQEINNLYDTWSTVKDEIITIHLVKFSIAQTTLNKYDKNKIENRGENMSSRVCVYLMRSDISLTAKLLQIPEI